MAAPRRPSRRRRRRIKIIWILLWTAVLTPLFVATFRRVLYFHPVITPSEVLAWLRGEERQVLVDLRGVSLADLETGGAQLATQGARWAGGARGLELSLDRSGQAWGCVELAVPPFSLIARELIVDVASEGPGVGLDLVSIEQDQDRWRLPRRMLPAGGGELRISIADLTYEPVADVPLGLQDIARLYLCLSTQVPSPAGAALRRVSTAPLQVPAAQVIAAPPTDERGYRNTYPEVGPPGALRIALLGDSMVYGSGLKTEGGEAALPLGRKLEESLRRELPGTEVLEFGVAGYNTQQEVDLYEGTVRAFHPDVVLLFWYANDEEDVVAIAEASAQLRTSEKYRQLLTAIDDQNLVWRLINQEAHQRAGGGRSMELALTSLDRLDALTREDGVPVGLVVFWDTPAQQLQALRRSSEAKGWPLLDLDPLVGRFGPRRMFVQAERSPYDSHPSAFGHAAVAEAVDAFLHEQGLLK